MATKKVSTKTDPLEWLSANLAELSRLYPGEWIAVSNDAVVASAANVAELLRETGEMNIDSPFITQIPQGEVVWNTTFGNL